MLYPINNNDICMHLLCGTSILSTPSNIYAYIIYLNYSLSLVPRLHHYLWLFSLFSVNFRAHVRVIVICNNNTEVAHNLLMSLILLYWFQTTFQWIRTVSEQEQIFENPVAWSNVLSSEAPERKRRTQIQQICVYIYIYVHNKYI